MKNSITIKNSKAIIAIWKIFAWLDKCRWQTNQNYNLICYAKNDLTPSEKILTHWLCYIADRQMPFQRIWDLGGYVISDLVYRYTRENIDISKLISDEFLRNHQNKYYLKCNSDNIPELLKVLYPDSILNNEIIFSSRYLAIDLACMLRTLIILQNYDRDIIRYIVSIIGLDDTDLNTVARALHRLTYCNAGQYSFNGRNNNILDKSVYGKIREQADNFLKCEDDFRPFGSKRLWAALRDYVKSPEFKRLILEGLKRIDSKYGSKWENLCKQPNLIELPGDVWNNNPIFKNKLIGNFVVLRENQRSPEIMRSLYIDLKSDCNEHNLYPEQFDVTFDFIPRMCVKRNCEVCFFGSEGGKILCNPNKGKLCPVSLATCGYLNFCTPDNCEIQGNFETVKKLCKGPSIFKCTAVQNNFF